MKTKIVYSVVSDETDIYLEQLLLSVFSLRHHNGDVHVALVTDGETMSGLVGKRKSILKYFNEVVTVEAPDGYTKVMRSRYLKTTLRQHIQGNYLFLDTDTLIAEPLDDIDLVADTGVKIAAVRDIHLSVEQMKEVNMANRHGLVLDASLDREYFNSGVMYVADVPETHDFYSRWNSNWASNCQLRGESWDQPPLALTNREFPDLMQCLDDKWNCMVIVNGIPYLSTSKVIHYFASGAEASTETYMFNDRLLLEKVKQQFEIPSEILPYVVNPRTAFFPYCRIVKEYDAKQFYSLRILMKYYPKSFRIFRFCAKVYLRTLDIITGRTRHTR